MYFVTVTAFAALPFLMAAVPASPNSSRTNGPSLRSFSLTKHSNHSNSHGFVDPRKVQAAVQQIEAKYERAFSAYEKRTGEAHRLASKRTHLNQREIVSKVTPPIIESAFTDTGDNMNVLWTIDVTIGKPGNVFAMQMDTFTADTFICGVSCLTCYEKKRYDYTLSSTANNTKKQGTLNNLRGPVTGEIVRDVMNPGGYDANVTMVVATKIDLSLQSIVFMADGVMGMGMKSSINADSYFTEVLANTGLNSIHGPGVPVFGMVLSNNGTGPKFMFGGTDTNKLVGKLLYTQVTKNAIFWEIELKTVKVNGNDINITNMEAVIDSSSSFIGGDSGDIAKLYSKIPGSAPDPTNPSRFTIPCKTTTHVVLEFPTINGDVTDITITPSTYNIGPVDSTGILCHGAFISQSSFAFWVLGTPFMENAYVEFDQGSFYVGLGQST